MVLVVIPCFLPTTEAGTFVVNAQYLYVCMSTKETSLRRYPLFAWTQLKNTDGTVSIHKELPATNIQISWKTFLYKTLVPYKQLQYL